MTYAGGTALIFVSTAFAAAAWTSLAPQPPDANHPARQPARQIAAEIPPSIPPRRSSANLPYFAGVPSAVFRDCLKERSATVLEIRHLYRYRALENRLLDLPAGCQRRIIGPGCAAREACHTTRNSCLAPCASDADPSACKTLCLNAWSICLVTAGQCAISFEDSSGNPCEPAAPALSADGEAAVRDWESTRAACP